MKIDLHMHTTLSDGRLTPTELVQLLARQSVDAAAITDHDSTEGLDEAFAEAERHPGLRLISGVEISADHPDGEREDVHVLGYFLDRSDADLQRNLREFREERDDRGQRMVEKLAALGYAVDWERVKEIAGKAGVGRPHVAQALVEKGYISEVKQAFDGLLNGGGAAFVDRPHISLAGAVEMIRSAGGAAVLAHPLYVAGYAQMVPRLAEMGIVGLEVHYAEFDPEQRRALLALAERHGLLPCGGSDYHAFGRKNEALPGSAGPPVEVLDELERLAGVRRR